MKRREAIKSMTLSSGMLLSSGTVLSLLQACSSGENNPWNPVFFSQEEADLFIKLSDVFLPTTDTPGANDVGVPQIVDLLMKDVFTEERAGEFREWLQIVSSSFYDHQKKAFGESSEEDKVKFLESLYELSEKEWQEVTLLLDKDPAPREDNRYLLYHALHNLKQTVVNAYCTSRKIGEEVLSYDPVPGDYLGCIPVQDVKNVWSY